MFLAQILPVLWVPYFGGTKWEKLCSDKSVDSRIVKTVHSALLDEKLSCHPNFKHKQKKSIERT